MRGQPAPLAPLTEEQRRFAEQNHGLIYAFLKGTGHNTADYYGAAALGFLQAVQRYLTQPWLRRYAFPTVAWRAMGRGVATEHRTEERRRNAEKRYLDNPRATKFYSSVLNYVDLCGSVLVHTHFRDCELSHVMLQTAKLKTCSTIDCTMDGVDYAGATLDGCTFNRITAGSIRLDYTTITQGGATEEECRQNREAVYRALGVNEVAA